MWWETVYYCLSTSLSEGNPNNVIEAMAKGIKPVIHNWPGAEDQFKPWLFSDVSDAAAQILSPQYESKAYRAWIEDRFSVANIAKVIGLSESMLEKDAA